MKHQGAGLEIVMEKLILSADDDRDILDCIDLILSAEGYCVITSLSPENIFQDIIHYNPDLILLDINLGEYNGLEICKDLKSNEQTKHIIVIMLSSDDRIYEAMNCYHADAIISKPFNISELIETIDRFLTPKIIPINRAS